MPGPILLVCGSLQQQSANRAALAVIQRSVVRGGGSVATSVEVDRLPHFNPDDNDTSAPVGEFRKQLSQSASVVIATPEYAAALPGSLKNALDWIVGSGELYAKPVGLVSAGSTGGVHARRQLIRSLTWQGAHVVAHTGISSPRVKSDDDGRLTDPPTLAELDSLATTMLSVPAMTQVERLALVEATTTWADVEPGHIAPLG